MQPLSTVSPCATMLTPVLDGEGQEKEAYCEVRLLNLGKIAEVKDDLPSESGM